ncbi:N-acetyl-1-D-myo-inositol-2-amino-2-deoxy-alpha-D-glucopyranoside deacetylase [Mycolicibacterium vinylchloridicum]|uniref:N-acetyl-1-D-myo-inositol-2-amino-2-deoxy-alpha- D-glucopyranoside deacetylase n=1 Tax=Mycolicibacterium vinylchloridicum TaxID=2736928 RepID=UPI0015C944E6|nr:N-acetyl-1-D-myo-inositol-2-amino-2-deoxy-alpha-D-glucopyranoside deacetylase [Mycolicibacterium vinylchloridicum]
MASQETPRLLFVHAHPDDETMNNGVTIARYVERGAEVTVVTCTLGEEGEIIDERWLELAVDAADQLGGYRIYELTTALQTLGLPGPRFLGGAGHWRDSGMPGTPERGHTKFVDADFDEAVGLLVAIIDELRPHVVATYDPGGGYGHPDHIQTHRITTAAVAAATWKVPKFYWGGIGATAFREAGNALSDSDVLADWIRPPADVVFGFTDDQITAVIEAPEHVDAKVDAIAAHATQMLVGPTRRAFTLSNKVVLPVLSAEHYVLVEGTAGPTDERGWETDLLAGLDLGQ